MAYTTDLPGAQQIGVTDTVQNHPLGMIVKGWDPTYGTGEFIYLKGVASTAVGSIVTYNGQTWATALGIAARDIPRPVAVAMSANVASQFGWYQISGIAVAAKSSATCLVAGVALGLLTTATGLAVATATGREILGALVATTASAKAGVVTVPILIQRPHLMGRDT